MKIGLMSDIHATVAPLKEALEIFHRENIKTILCAGDIAGYGCELDQTIELLMKKDCQVVVGNHDLWQVQRSNGDLSSMAEGYLLSLAEKVVFSCEEKSVYIVHASPPDSPLVGIKLLDEKGCLMPDQINFWADELSDFNSDVLVVGHTHQIFAEKLGSTLVINPGSTKFNHTCAILDMAEMRVEFIPLENKSPVISWNWGMQYLAR